jgi:putative DNA primase/helicase
MWRERIALGSVSLIAGEPGLGKSQIAATMAAKVSSGGKWPLKEGSAPEGDVFMLIGEDDFATTVKPRLMAAEANLDRIHLVGNGLDPESDSFNLIDDLHKLWISIKNAEDPKLLIIDPVSAFLGPHINDHGRARQLLSELDSSARQYGIAIVLIAHLTKNGRGSALSRIGGSTAIGAAVRAAHMVMRGAPGSEWQIFACAKINLAANNSALQFRVKPETVDDIKTTRIAWHKDCLEMTADEALALSRPAAAKPTQARAIDELLKGLLADGKRAVSEIFAKGEKSGFTEKQLRMAAARLGVVKTNKGFAQSKKWFWELPAAPKVS